MKPHYTLSEAVKFFRSLSTGESLTALYLVHKFDGVYISDLAQALQVSQAQVTNLCVKLERAGIIQKESVSRPGGGRIVLVKLDKDAKSVLSHFFLALSSDPEIAAVVETYQELKDSNSLVSSQYGL